MKNKSIYVVEFNGHPQAESNFDTKEEAWRWVLERKFSTEMNKKCTVVEYVRK